MDTIQIIISSLLAIAVLVGISMMSKVKSSVNGNLLSALAMLCGVVATLFFSEVVSAWTIYPAIIVGALIGSTMAKKVQMIQMPQVVALFNGLGGGASACVGIMSASLIGFSNEQLSEITNNGYLPFVMFIRKHTALKTERIFRADSGKDLKLRVFWHRIPQS